MKQFIVVLIVCLLGVLSVHAQESVDDQGNPNDPRVNERANACYAGAAWEYTCGDDLYLWEAGWYFIRLQTGMFSVSDIPYGLWWMLPEGSEPVGTPTFGICKEFYILLGRSYYAVFDSPTGDLETVGDPFWIDVPDCSGAPFSTPLSAPWNIAYAPSGAAQAAALCGATPLRQHSADIFVCAGA
jgi:hypothetical protein